MRRKRWVDVTTADVDEAVERQQERELQRYEAEQDRLEAQADEREAWHARER